MAVGDCRGLILLFPVLNENRGTEKALQSDKELPKHSCVVSRNATDAECKFLLCVIVLGIDRKENRSEREVGEEGKTGYKRMRRRLYDNCPFGVVETARLHPLSAGGFRRIGQK